MKSQKKTGKDAINLENTSLHANTTITNFTNGIIVNSTTHVAISREFQTPTSIRKRRNGTFSSFPIVNTPTPPTRRIVNPFETGNTERLHLPFIDSPSLFHRPVTPQSSTQFEWTIDEVSSLNPANVEAHETQFVSVVDPEYEAKAQAAISSFFKEGIIVPSPDDGPIREKLVLSKKLRDSPNSKITRDNCCQTELTLPPILPKDVEDMLKPYFTFTQNQQQSPAKVSNSPSNNISMISEAAIDHEARDASLRRKLFQTCTNTSENCNGYERDIHLDSPVPQTPEMVLKNIRSRRYLTPRNAIANENQSPLDISLSSVERESFGCISPISKVATTTPSTKYKHKSLDGIAKETSPSLLLFRSTPDRSAPIRWKSLDSTNENGTHSSSFSKRKSFQSADDRSSESNETDNFSYDDEMHFSYGSQQHPQTPTLNKSKRRCNSVNRKNLSRSFNQIEESNLTSAISLDKTDSGFNEINEKNHIFLKSPTNKYTNFTEANCDISMASVN